MLAPMRPRQYSISSSPLSNPSVATLTVSVLNEPAADGRNRFLGVTTTYLANLSPGDHCRVSVKHSRQGFHLPLDITLPVIMICAGTGIAPFRGFIQERAIQITTGNRKLGPALLFFGCKAPELDALHRAELTEWEELGAVKVKYAFSRASERSEGCKHVQDLLWKEREGVRSLFEIGGAKIYVCGSSAMGEGVKDVVKKIWIETGDGRTEQEAVKWFEDVKRERYYSDVFT